jgi:hypothetical protein
MSAQQGLIDVTSEAQLERSDAGVTVHLRERL